VPPARASLNKTLLNMATIVIADLRAQDRTVNKDTVAGGYGSRFRADSAITRFAKLMRRVFLNLPSIHVGYLASIFARAGHQIIITHDDRPVTGDLALVLTSLVDYQHERAWGAAARARGLRVGYFGLTATKLPELFEEAGDLIIDGEPEAAAFRLAAGEDLRGRVVSPAIDDLDSLPFPRWDFIKTSRFSHASHSGLGLKRAFPMLTSRSCPEHCTYCPHRITAAFRQRSVASVIAELAELDALYPGSHIKIRDPLFTLDRDRTFQIAEAIRERKLRLTLECETRMDDLDEKMIHALHAAHFTNISFGVETPDPAILKRVARRFIPHEHMRRMVALCWALGMTTTGFYVIGFLQDTEESIEGLIRFACELDTTFANFKILTPYPGTPQFKQLKPLIFETDWEQFDGYTLTFNHPNLTPRRARLMIGMANSRYIARPSQLLNWLGLHRYTRRPLVQRADDWIWSKQDYWDRSWVAERKALV
jgi:anaerobic magnesium-protoporphyrin IX monomethyl ester cyclase